MQTPSRPTDPDSNPPVDIAPNVLRMALEEVGRAKKTSRATTLARNHLTPERTLALVEMAATHTTKQLSAHFGITPAAVHYHLKAHDVAAQNEHNHKLSPEAKAFIATSDLPALKLARIFSVTTPVIYAIWKDATGAPRSQQPDRVGHKVTEALLEVILDPRLSAFDAAQKTGLSVPTVYNYRRKHKASQPPGVEDLV